MTYIDFAQFVSSESGDSSLPSASLRDSCLSSIKVKIKAPDKSDDGIMLGLKGSPVREVLIKGREDSANRRWCEEEITL